jgi:hypothetical protein
VIEFTDTTPSPNIVDVKSAVPNMILFFIKGVMYR